MSGKLWLHRFLLLPTALLRLFTKLDRDTGLGAICAGAGALLVLYALPTAAPVMYTGPALDPAPPVGPAM
jgi:hypothetical protein